MKYICRSKNESGFTLIEMAVVVVIVGIIISIMATVLPSLIQSAKIRKARAILEKVDYALQGYSMANNRLPFADTGTDGDEDDGSYTGNLPYKTLGLSSADDVWGNPIKYGVYSTLTATFADTTAFCAAISSAGIAAKFLSEVYTTTDESCPGTTDNISNQAYVVASGGPKDLDGSNGFFDLCNGETGAGFNAPNRIQSTTYDDLVRAFALNELNYKNCTGGTGGGTTGVENTDALCTDDIDNDNDGYTDCYDQDCCGSGLTVCSECPPSTNVQINTSAMPPGTVGGSYSHTFEATGGSGYYYWYLDSIAPAISKLSINQSSGTLSGTINVCEGAYTVNVRVEDRHDSSKTDSHAFTLNVNKETLSITPAPNGLGESNPDFTVNSSTFSQIFTVSGSHVGDFNWALNWVGTDPGGFQVDDISGSEGNFRKSSSTTEGTYTFTLTATDSTCAANTKTTNSYTIKITPDGTGGPYSADLVAEWHMDECSWNGTAGEVNDSGELALNGTAQNGADTTGAGKICRAGGFDGTNDYIIVDSADELKLTAPFSIALWVKVHSNQSNWVRLAGKGNHPTHNYGLWLATNGTILFHIDSASGQGRSQTTVTVNDGNWHHVVGVYDSTTMKVYIDNVERSSINYSHTPYTSNDPFTMGYDGQYTYLNGCLDEVMLFNKALPATHATETSVDTIYNLTRSSCTGACYTEPVAEYRMENFPWNGTANEVKDSGTGVSHGVAAAHGTGGALPSQTTPSGGKVCRAGVFTRVDASNGGYLDLGDPTDGDLDPYTDPWTISAWIKWDGSSGIIYNKENLYEAQVSGGYVNYAWQPHWAWDGGTSFPVTADEWTYVTIVYDGSQQILYKNGDMVYSRAQTGAMGNNSSKLLIGARGSASPNDFFGGMIDEVKIYNRALAENEIRADKDETRDCSADTVVITTTELPDGTIYSAYSYIITATGGEEPPGGYGWEIVYSDIPAPPLKIGSNTGELNGTLEVCAGDYNITVRVTDANSRTDERTFTLTVVNDILTISPSAPRTFKCTTSDFSRDFSVSGPRGGALENWGITWVTDPEGFEVIKTGDATVRFRKIGTSSTGTYHFRLTANDSICTNNTIDSGLYILNISGEGADEPYYAGHVGEWWLDETKAGTAPGGKDVTDYSGNDNHGTAYGGVTYGVQGKVWTALEFDGSSGYVDCGNKASLNISAGDFTIGAWIKPASNISTPGQRYTIMAKYNPGWIMDLPNDGGVEGYRFYSGSAAYKYTPPGNQFSLEWTHFIVTRNSTTNKLKLYLNSELKQTWDMTTVTPSANPLLIGKRTGGLWFNGIIDEAQIYNRELSAAEITDLYNQASLVAYYKMDETESGTAPGGKDVYDYSGQANHGTNYGAAYGATGQIGTALEFDGTDYVNIGNNEILTPSDISISAWVKASTLDNWNGIITNKPGANHGINLQMGTAQRIAALVGNGSSCTYVSTTWAPAVDTWYHIVITHNSSDNKNILYVNGNKETESTFALAYSTSVDTIIGRFYTGSLPFKGIIDEIRIYGQVLSADDVTALFNKGIEEGG